MSDRLDIIERNSYDTKFYVDKELSPLVICMLEHLNL